MLNNKDKNVLWVCKTSQYINIYKKGGVRMGLLDVIDILSSVETRGYQTREVETSHYCPDWVVELEEEYLSIRG